MTLGVDSIFDLDIYSRRISFFYRGKEKISSKFGFFLTSLYIIISIVLFLNYFIRTISRENVTAADSTIFPDSLPSIEINQDIFNIAFGLEHPVTINRFIDETIYYPKATYIENVKQDGFFVNKIKQDIKLDKCGEIKSGNKFKSLLGKDDLNNSYCFIDYNFSLKGGYKYNEIGYIKINIFPCINSTDNNNHCQSKNIIDKFFENNHFSILASDTALIPNNFSNPGMSVLLNTYTSIDKLMKKDYIIKYALTEIETDLGLFIQDIKKDKYLKYLKDFDQFFFVDSDYLFSGKEVLSLTIRLDDNIYFQKRTYTKMAEVFATTGGYMQLLYTVFCLISILTKKMNIEKKLLNSLFYFNIKQKKVILSIEYKKKLNYVTSESFVQKSEGQIKDISELSKNNNSNNNINFIPYLAKKSPMLKKYTKMKSDKNNKNNKLIFSMRRKSVNLGKDEQINKVINGQNDASMDNLINNSILQKNNAVKNTSTIQPKKSSINKNHSNLNNAQINHIYFRSKSHESENSAKIENNNYCNIKFNIFQYYCLWRYSNKFIHIELFKFAYNFFKSQMDIINFFNIIILTQIMMKKQSNEKHDFLSQIVELSM